MTKNIRLQDAFEVTAKHNYVTSHGCRLDNFVMDSWLTLLYCDVWWQLKHIDMWTDTLMLAGTYIFMLVGDEARKAPWYWRPAARLTRLWETWIFAD